MTERDPGSPLWAVTTFFNPAGYNNRLRNFRVFRQQLSVPLLAVELSFNGRFELQPGDAEILLRWRVGDVMWQKERLLNGAWPSLPAHCTEVAWLDCDIVFSAPDWATQARAQLQNAAVVHGFRTLRHLAPGSQITGRQEVSGTQTSVQLSAFHLLEQHHDRSRVLDGVLTRADGAPTAGIAWVARRDWISRLRLFDACIAGGGDTAWGAALLGQPEDAVALHAMNTAQRQHYLQWAASAQAPGGKVGCLSGDVLHLWHGALKDRQSRERHGCLSATGFDPLRDLAATGNEPWRWTDPDARPARYLREYFQGRKEDGEL